ncbi:GNAT family N-acetyltransferase [Methyloversatilis thermotolerans]|uniref:GNAT family N-acetyltransferase n=1 Tax=Methyloversatilis thermotolerans TaxID=1346290 RepID=UPI00035F3A5D|nr:GNAT family N-acetyltransferase [Methyloversatilis thermotolerans]
MVAELAVIRVATARAVLEPDWLTRAEPVHRALRPDLPADYAGLMRDIVDDGGEVAVAVSAAEVLGVTVFRCYRNTSSGLHFYVDDLVTAPRARSRGVGKTLLDWLMNEAQTRGASRLRLDSATHRFDAHRFYHREGMHIACFHFSRDLV